MTATYKEEENEEETLKKALLDFVIRVSGDHDRTDEEVKVLPEITRILLNYFFVA